MYVCMYVYVCMSVCMYVGRPTIYVYTYMYLVYTLLNSVS